MAFTYDAKVDDTIISFVMDDPSYMTDIRIDSHAFGDIGSALSRLNDVFAERDIPFKKITIELG